MTPKTNIVAEISHSIGGGSASVSVRERPFGAFPVATSLSRALQGLSDRAVLGLVSALLFAVGAWPLLLVECPPFQDLPNHLATAVAIRDPSLDPNLAFNGFLKTNAALFFWLHFAGGLVGLKLAAKMFALACLGAMAYVLPRFVYAFTGSRGRALVAGLFAWPMVHNWFLSMGMLDYALAVPLGLFLLMLLERHRRDPSWATGGGIVLTSLAVWYAHVFVLLVVSLLVGIHLTLANPVPRRKQQWIERVVEARRLLAPLLPSTFLVGLSVWLHISEPGGAMKADLRIIKIVAPWELAYNMWAEWLWAFSKLSISSVVVAVTLPILAWARRREHPTFFSPAAILVMSVAYVFVPYSMATWFHVNSRFIPFLWAAMLLRVPETLPRRVIGLMALCAALYTVGMGVDYLRLDAERARFVAGVNAVPARSRLLAFVFRPKIASENTRNLLHAWGYYAVERNAIVPLVFAHSRSFPLSYREPPEPRFHQLMLESRAQSMATPEYLCSTHHVAGDLLDDCRAHFVERWQEFWRAAEPRFDSILLWAAPPETRALVPDSFRVAFERDELVIFVRKDRDEARDAHARR